MQEKDFRLDYQKLNERGTLQKSSNSDATHIFFIRMLIKVEAKKRPCIFRKTMHNVFPIKSFVSKIFEISYARRRIPCHRKNARKIPATLPDYKRASRASIVGYCTIWGTRMKNDWTYRSVASAHRSEKRDNLVSSETPSARILSRSAIKRRLLIFPREEKRSRRISKRKKRARVCNRLQIIAATTHAWRNGVYMRRM